MQRVGLIVFNSAIITGMFYISPGLLFPPILCHLLPISSPFRCPPAHRQPLQHVWYASFCWHVFFSVCCFEHPHFKFIEMILCMISLNFFLFLLSTIFNMIYSFIFGCAKSWFLHVGFSFFKKNIYFYFFIWLCWSLSCGSWDLPCREQDLLVSVCGI